MTLQELSQKAREIVLKDGYHAPMLFVEGTNGMVPVLLDLTHEGDSRFLYMRGLGRHLALDKRHGDLQQLFMVSEVWMVLAKDGKMPAPRPSQDPHRIEALVIGKMTLPDRKPGMAIFEMVRDAAGKVTDLQPIDLPKGGPLTPQSPLLDAFLDGYTQADTPTH
jgi:hypothetical protein